MDFFHVKQRIKIKYPVRGYRRGTYFVAKVDSNEQILIARNFLDGTVGKWIQFRFCEPYFEDIDWIFLKDHVPSPLLQQLAVFHHSLSRERYTFSRRALLHLFRYMIAEHIRAGREPSPALIWEGIKVHYLSHAFTNPAIHPVELPSLEEARTAFEETFACVIPSTSMDTPTAWTPPG